MRWLKFEVSESFIKKLHLANWLLTVALALAVFILGYERSVILGVILGGVIANLNFHSLHKDVKTFISRWGGKGRGLLLVKYYARLAVVGVVLYFLITNKIVNPLSLLVGLSVVVINILRVAFSEVVRDLSLRLKEG